MPVWENKKKRAEPLPTYCFLGGPPKKSDTIRSGYLTTTFLRAPNKVELQLTPTVWGSPQKRRQHQNAT